MVINLRDVFLCLFLPNLKLFHPGVLVLTVRMQVDEKDRLPVWNWFQPTKQESIGVKLSGTDQETGGNLCQDRQTVELVQVWKIALSFDSC